jgi:hypothetical protein
MKVVEVVELLEPANQFDEHNARLLKGVLRSHMSSLSR